VRKRKVISPLKTIFNYLLSFIVLVLSEWFVHSREERIMDDSSDRFPIGMRVLAVDDDPSSLLLLETLLRSCQYHGLLLFDTLCPIYVYNTNDDDDDVLYLYVQFLLYFKYFIIAFCYGPGYTCKVNFACSE